MTRASARAIWPVQHHPAGRVDGGRDDRDEPPGSTWSLVAASSAVLGITLVFTIWWWYFDGVEAVAERFVRSSSDAVRFHVWSYAHLPLYLGIAVAGVGVEHFITTVTRESFIAPSVDLCSALALVTMALMVIGRVSSPETRRGDVAPSHDTGAAVERAPG